MMSFIAMMMVFTLMAGDTVTGNDIHKIETARTSLENEIVQKICDIEISDKDMDILSVKMQFLINDKNELIVLRTDNEKVDKILKSRLNYVELETRNIERNTPYSIKITLRL